MQIPDNPFKFLDPGILRQPQPGTRQQADAELQAKAGAALARTSATAAPTNPRARPAADLTGPGAQAHLERAVRTLAAEGRLPPRGSLVNLSV